MSKIPLEPFSTLALRQRRARLLRTLTVPPGAIHASFLERFLKCGRPNCHCRKGDPHGPFYYLSRCLPKRRMRSLLLKKPAQIARGRQAVAAYQQLLERLDELSWINWELLRRGDPLAAE